MCCIIDTKKVTIKRVPDIRDVNILINLLIDLGVKVTKEGADTFTFESNNVNLDYLKSDEFAKKASSIRGSVMIVGPLLSRFGVGYIPKPGGDKIGRRRMDTHFTGFMNLGAQFNYDKKNRHLK